MPRRGRAADLARFLAEDAGRGDPSGALVPPGRVRAEVTAGGACVVAGARHARAIFAMRGCSARALVADGRRARRGQRVMAVSGPARGVLACERTALNLMSRMSGIATQARMMAGMLPPSVGLYHTRKTAPGLRAFDAEAVVLGGGRAHRAGLDGGVMIKDNHVAAAGSAEALLRRAARRHGRFEAEADDLAGAVAAARAGASTVMLDNFTPAGVRRAVAELERLGLRRRVRLEASGGIGPSNVRAYARAGVDMVSSGALTHSVTGVDFGLRVLGPAAGR